jgi:hypothetical protein
MKTCTYCGKEHPDHATVCSIDGQPLRSLATTVLAIPHPEQPHSRLGIASFSISMAVGCLVLVVFLVAAILNAGRPPRGQGQEIVGFAILFLLAADLGAVGLGIAALCEPGKKKLFGILGLVFSSSTLLGCVGLIIIGLMMTGRLRH